MDAGVYHPLSLLVSNYGYAAIEGEESSKGFTPYPVVNAVSPLSGSVRGGTRVTLTGTVLTNRSHPTRRDDIIHVQLTSY